jgi:hypothetical protein
MRNGRATDPGADHTWVYRNFQNSTRALNNPSPTVCRQKSTLEALMMTDMTEPHSCAPQYGSCRVENLRRQQYPPPLAQTLQHAQHTLPTVSVSFPAGLSSPCALTRGSLTTALPSSVPKHTFPLTLYSLFRDGPRITPRRPLSVKLRIHCSFPQNPV